MANTSTYGLKMMSNAAYHAGPGVSKSHLDVIAQSPRHYWEAYVKPDRPARTPTPAMVQGTLIHAAILEPDLLTRDFVVEPENINRRTKEGKAEFEAWARQHEHKTIVSADQWATAIGCRDAVLANPTVAELFKHGHAEQSFFGLDADTGITIKCRTDWLDLERARVVDVKSTTDASPEGFIRSIMDYRYHVQVPWYLDVIDGALGQDQHLRWTFVAVEKAPPYAIGLYTLPADVVQAGRALARRDLTRIATCRMLDSWGDYSSGGSVELEFPAWARQRMGINTAEAAFT